MERVLVTGASGYIGQHLCLSLHKADWYVRGISRDQRPKSLSAIEWISGDITNADIAARSLASCHAVVHLACLPLKASEDDPQEALRINVGGTLQILEAARLAGVKRLVYISSGQVYGGKSSLPNVETDLPQTDNIYAISKLCGEIWAEAYNRIYGVPTQILRLFNVYGVAVNKQLRPTVETVFLRQIQRSQQPQIRGNPHSGRDFIHVQDVVRAIILALTEPIFPGPINIGSGVFTTLVELAQLAAQLWGQPLQPEILHRNEPQVCFQADITRAQLALKFRADVPLKVGLTEIVKQLRTYQ